MSPEIHVFDCLVPSWGTVLKGCGIIWRWCFAGESELWGGGDLKFDRQALRPLGSLFVLGEVVGEAASHFRSLSS